MTVPNGVTVDLALQDIFKKSGVTALDCAIVGCVLVAALLMLVVFGRNGEAATACVIKINGEEWARYDLSALDKEKVIEIKNSYGENTVVIDKNGVYVSYSNCADKSEINMGRISKSGESLICLPHRLEIYLTGENQLDGTSW